MFVCILIDIIYSTMCWYIVFIRRPKTVLIHFVDDRTVPFPLNEYRNKKKKKKTLYVLFFFLLDKAEKPHFAQAKASSFTVRVFATLPLERIMRSASATSCSA